MVKDSTEVEWLYVIKSVKTYLKIFHDVVAYIIDDYLDV